MSLAQRIVEQGEIARDAYELAGCARFAPRLEDMQAGLKRLAAENTAYVGHWQKETRAKGQQLQQLIEQTQGIFASREARERYDEQLLARLRRAYADEIAGQTGEPLRRWLRMSQNIHSSRIEDVARKLTDTRTTKIAPAVVVSTTPVEVKMPQPAAGAAAPPARKPRPPQRPAKPDDFALLWIVGTAVGTAVVLLIVLLYVFRDRFGPANPPAIAQEPTPIVVEPEPIPSIPVPQEPETPETPELPTTPAPKLPPREVPKPVLPMPMPSPTPPVETPPMATTTTPVPVPTPPPMPAPQPPGSRQLIEFGRPVHALDWDGSGKQLALAGEGSEVLIWDVAKGVEGKRLAETFPSASSVAFASGSRTVAAATSDGAVFVWNVASGKVERTVRHADLNDPRTLTFIPGSGDSQILIGDGAGALRTFTTTATNPTAALELGTEAGAIQAITCSTKRPIAVTAHLDGTVVVWNLTGKSILKCFMAPGAPITKTLTSPGAANSKAAELTYWSHEVCLDVALSPDDTLLAVAATDLELWEFDAARRMVRRRFLPGVPGAKGYRVVDFSSDGALVAAANAEGTLVVVDVSSWNVVLQEKLPAAVLCLGWHPSDPRQLAVGLDNGQAQVIPLTKNIQTQKATPDFEVDSLIATLKILTEEESWHDASRLLAVLSAYPLPVAARTDVDRYRATVKKGVQKLVDEIQIRDVREDTIEDAEIDLQLGVDIDPLGTLGKDARAKLRGLPARTPAILIKLAAADAAANKNRAVQPQFAPNPGFPINPGIPFGPAPVPPPRGKRPQK